MTTQPATLSNPRSSVEDLSLRSDVFLLSAPDGSARLIDLGGRFYALSETAGEMLVEALGYGVKRAAERIAGRYGIEVDQVRSDLGAFLTDLRRAKLIGPPRAAWRGLPWLARPLLPALWAAHRLPVSTRVRASALLALARAAFRTLGWTRTVAAFRHYHRGRAARPATESQVGAIDDAVRDAASAFPVSVECKERALACWSLAREGGLAALLIVGANTHPLEGHCWCEAGGLVLSDYADRCRTFTPVIEYD